MPRIAVAVMVVVTMGVCIGINTVRFPVVWEMINTPRAANAPRVQAATQEPVTAPTPAPPRGTRAIDLSDMAPPMIHGDLPEAQGLMRTLGSPEPDVLDGGNDTQSAYPSSGGNSMHFVSEPSAKMARPRDGPDTSAGRDLAVTNNAPSSEIPSPGTLPHGSGPSHDTPVDTAAPIVFGPGPAERNDSSSDAAVTRPPGTSNTGAGAGADTLPEASAESTPWPAQMSPILKFAAKPRIPGGELGDWRAERPLVPIDWPDDKPSPTSSSWSLVERLPEVEPTEQIAPWARFNRPPDSPIPIYPSTGM